MRILFLNPLGILGGAERVLLDLFAPLQRAMPSAHLSLVTGSDGPLVERAAHLGVETVVLPMSSGLAGLGWGHGSGSNGAGGAGPTGRAVRLARGATTAATGLVVYGHTLSRAIARLEPDVVHSNGIKTHLLSAVAVPPRVPVLWHIHDFLGDRGALARVLGLASFRAAAAVANSRAVADDARRTFAPSRCPVEVVYNGVDVDAVFTPGRPDPDLLDRLGGAPPAPAGTLRVGLVATYARWKGHELFLEAAAALRARCPSVPLRFYVVGGPVYLTAGSQYSGEELRARAAALGLDGSVVFVPFQDDPAAAYRALDVVVHASTKREPFGRTIVEAMATARTVLVADAGGAAELFTHDVDAVGYRAGDVGALTDALATVVVDAALRERLGRAARASAVSRFSCERLGGAFATIYGRLAESFARR